MSELTPFAGRILWVHWEGDRVEEESIGELAANIARDTPNVAGVLVKSSDGHHWQGHYDGKRALAVSGPERLAAWAGILASQGLELHLWCVLRGAQVEAEAARVVEACAVPGVRSMLLDVESGPAYFGGRSAAEARALISRIRAGVGPDFHLGLNFDARGGHPRSIHIGEWLPEVQSLHPMVYHQAFGRHPLQWWLDHILDICRQLAPHLPVVPMLGSFPVDGRPVAPAELRAGIDHALRHAEGVSLFRLGNVGALCSPTAIRRAVAAGSGKPTRRGGVVGGNRIGLNINAAEADREAVLAHCREAGATSYLVMNDHGFAQRLHEHLGGRSIIVARGDWPDDTTDIPVEKLLSRWSDRARIAPDVYHYYPNEPIPHDACPLPELLRRLVALMDACRERGVKACVGNFATGTVPQWSDVQAGVWDDFIRTALAFSADGGGYVGFHDYGFGVLPWGCAGRDPQDLINQPQRVAARSNWPTAAEVEAAPDSNWHLMRFTMLAARARQLGLPMFPLLITEFGWDRMPNLELEGVIPWFDARMGKTRGPLKQVPMLSRHWFGEDCDALAVAREQLQWAEATYPDYVRGLHLFAWNNNALWEEFNYAAWPGALDMLRALQGGAGARPRSAAIRPPARKTGKSTMLAALAEIDRQVDTIRRSLESAEG